MKDWLDKDNEEYGKHLNEIFNAAKENGDKEEMFKCIHRGCVQYIKRNNLNLDYIDAVVSTLDMYNNHPETWNKYPILALCKYGTLLLLNKGTKKYKQQHFENSVILKELTYEEANAAF